MNKAKHRSLLAILACLLALLFSVSVLGACGSNETADVGENANGTWYYGVTAPAAELGENGDHYLNTETLTAYAKTADGTWQSTALYSGAEAPDASAGETGDLYLDTKNGVLYQKGDTLWSIVLTLKGKPGRDGVVWFSGEKDPEKDDPALADAQNGDFYLNTKEFTVWQLQEGVWTNLGGLTGAQGAVGPAGPAGPAGPTGAQGTTGAAGKDGVDGKSAYELYVEQYKEAHGGSDADVLTEEQWLASLKGEQGEQGKQGETGKTGDQGPIGPDGKSAYELYVEQFRADEENAGKEPLSLEQWLASLKGDKGDKGDPGKDSIHFYNGDGAPSAEITEKAVEGDLYVGQFTGTDGKGSGSILYRYDGTKWDILMESMTQPGTVSIYTLEKLNEFSALVAEGKISDGLEVHLKADINFNEAEGFSLFALEAAVEWTPIGTTAHPFNGIFDGEGHTITGLTVSGANAGLFAVTENATIKNLTIVDANVEAEANGKAGILVAEAKGTLELKNIEIENSTVKAADGASGTTVGAVVGSAAEAEKVTAGGVTVELTAESSSEIAQDSKIVGDGEVTYSKEEGASGFKAEVEEGFSKLVDLANDNQETYEISSLEGFKKFRDTVNTDHETYQEKVVSLVAGIELDEENWTPIGQDGYIFEGTFDGKGNTISNLTITGEGTDVGLFSKLGSGAEIKNLTLDTVNITGATAIGGFAGSSEGACTFTNCTVKNANLTGYNEIGAFIGSCVNGTVTNSKLEKVHITVDWEKETHGDTVDAGAYIGKDTEPTVDKASKSYESEVTFEYKGIMAKVGSKVYANVQDAFYAVYDMGADADNDGDIVIELLTDVTVDKTMIQKNAFKSGSSTYYAWIDAFGRSDGYGANGNHTGLNEKDLNSKWPSYTFNGNNHTITIADKALTSNYNEYLIYTGGNSDWTITFENLNIKGNAAKCTAFEIVMPSIEDNFMPEIVFKNVNVTGEWNTILHMNAKAIVTLDGCNFTNTLNEKPYSNSGSNKNIAFAVLMSYSGNGSSLYLKNGSYISSVSCGYYSSYSGYARVYVDATSSMNYEWILATFAVNNYVVQGAFIFDGDAPEALQLTDANKFEFSYEQQSQANKLFSTRIQGGQSETQWFLDTEVVTTLKALLG